LLRESHFRPEDPLYEPTKATLLAQVAAGKYELCETPPLVSMPWFGVPKPDGTIEGKYYKSTRISMGETCAPWAFQVWLHDMFKSFLRESEFTFEPIKKQHIDDLLFLFTSKAQARVFRDAWHVWAADHGLRLNLRKSTTEPTQV
ncbi:hypothetical protein BGZ89_008040, partial [Linnemannia elongata]